MPTWDPLEYLKFADYRLRPALDLLAQISLDSPRTVYDLGCGPGNITRLLGERWPGAAVTGVDSSSEMLIRARQEAPDVTFLQADIAQWSPPAPAHLLFSNATLHWLDDHRRLLPRLVAQLAPGGVLAVQMPRNHDAPSHLLIEAAGLGWALAAAAVPGAARFYGLSNPPKPTIGFSRPSRGGLIFGRPNISTSSKVTTQSWSGRRARP